MDTKTSPRPSIRPYVWLSIYCLLLVAGGANVLRVMAQNSAQKAREQAIIDTTARRERIEQRQQIELERRLTVLETKMDGLERMAWATLTGLAGLIITMVGRAATSVWAVVHDRRASTNNNKGDS